MTTRKSATVKTGTGVESSRRSTRKSNSKGVEVKAVTVSFTAPNAIADSGSGFTAAKGFAVGQRVTVEGSPKNSRTWTIVGRGDTTLTVTPQEITSEAAGPPILVRQGH